MATKFFNNENGDTLFAKLKGLVDGMGMNFHTFQAVSGYFRSSGYFKLRNELKDTQIRGEIQSENFRTASSGFYMLL